MTTENALPAGGNAEAGAASPNADANDQHQHHGGDQGAGAKEDAGNGQASEEGDGGQPKKEKTAEQREIERLRRRVDNLTRKRYDAEARAAQAGQQQHQQQNSNDSDDDEPVSMTRAELKQHIAEQARQLAPAMTQQQATADHRAGVVASLAKEWGDEKFNTLAADLDDAFGGLADRSGAPKAATDAIFESDDPKALIEYLADPDNADEAAQLAKLSAVQAGRAIGRLEEKLKVAKTASKPKPSQAAQPIEPPRGGGGSMSSMPDPSNTKAYIAWANAQDRAAR